MAVIMIRMMVMMVQEIKSFCSTQEQLPLTESANCPKILPQPLHCHQSSN